MLNFFRAYSDQGSSDSSLNGDIITSFEIVSAKINISDNVRTLPTKIWVQITSLRELDGAMYKVDYTKKQDRYLSEEVAEFSNAWCETKYNA